MKAVSRGAMLAAAVAAAFIANSARAADTSTPKPTMVACLGANNCKGQSLCKSFNHDCQGMNSCKGKGFVMMTDTECKTKGGKPIDPDQM